MVQVSPGSLWLYEGNSHPHDYGYPGDMRVPNRMLHLFWQRHFPEWDFAELVNDIFKACDRESVN